MSEEKHEEGVEVLDPKLKARQERQKSISTKVEAAINDLCSEHGLKLTVLGYDGEEDNFGIWVSDNVKQIDKMAFARLADANL